MEDIWRKYLVEGMSLLEKEAMIFSVMQHTKAGQIRKLSGEEYAVHPAGVASILRGIGSDPGLLAAAWLHDIKDCNISRSQVESNFGSDVANLVDEVSDIASSKDGNRKQRKALERRHLADASFRGKTLKLADVIDNTETIAERDQSFSMVYLPEKWEELQSLKGGHPALWDRALKSIEQAAVKIGVALNPSGTC